jgi:rhodanese-related sulfurtransferase
MLHWKRSRFSKNVILVICSLLLLIAISSQRSVVHSDQWKRQQISIMYAQYAAQFPQVESITVEQLQQFQRQHKKIILVDVRSSKEREVSIIPGSISVNQFEQNFAKYRDSTIVAYCTIGYRSGKYAQKLQQQGLKIFNLEGSLLAWSYIDGKLINETGETKKIHIFGHHWNLVAKNYQPVW